MPETIEAREMIAGHPEWAANLNLWQWLLDSREGGRDYVDATYPEWGLNERNLARHKHESDDVVGTIRRTNPDYDLRLARTPIPMLLAEALEAHLGAVYEQAINRSFGGSEILEEWAAGMHGGVDGLDTSLDEWMADEVAPDLMTLGQLDVLCDHPPAPMGRKPESQADVRVLNLDGCIARVVLPQYLRWWELAPDGYSYLRALISGTDADGNEAYRLWDAQGSRLYGADGEPVGAFIPHPYRRVPMVRLYDRRKPRCRNVGQSRYEGIAWLQRACYNVDSEEQLDCARYSHPIVQGPKEYCEDPSKSVPWSPGRSLPIGQVESGTGTTLVPWSYVPLPASHGESLRKTSDRLRDQADRIARLTKPAGAAGTSAGTVAQSGISKEIDERQGRNLLSRIARKLGTAEWSILDLAATVLHDGNPPKDFTQGLTVGYPQRFNLRSASALADLGTEFQAVLQAAGRAPLVEIRILQSMLREILPGLPDEGDGDQPNYGAMDSEIEERVVGQAARIAQDAEAFSL